MRVSASISAAEKSVQRMYDTTCGTYHLHRAMQHYAQAIHDLGRCASLFKRNAIQRNMKVHKATLIKRGKIQRQTEVLEATLNALRLEDIVRSMEGPVEGI
jgi:hypothetical protein